MGRPRKTKNKQVQRVYLTYIDSTLNDTLTLAFRSSKAAHEYIEHNLNVKSVISISKERPAMTENNTPRQTALNSAIQYFEDRYGKQEDYRIKGVVG